MRAIKFPEPKTQAWQKWRKACEKATQENIKMINEGGKAKKDKTYKGKKLYIGQKEEYVKKNGPFRGKCAYCESELDRLDGLDHFRPAMQVRNIDNKLLEDHPGYYWLIFCWKNLFPVCDSCNTRHEEEGRQVGKGNRFPVEGFLATKPGEEVNEVVLLLNPLFDDPDIHFKYDAECHSIDWETKEGKTCIEIFGFRERETLRQGWEKASKDVRNEYAKIVAIFDKSERLIKLDKFKKDIELGLEPHSFIRRNTLKSFKTETEEL